MNRFILVLLGIFSASLYAERETNQLERHFSLSSAYAERLFNSNEGLVNFPLSMVQAHSKLFDVATDRFRAHWLERLASVFADGAWAYWLTPALLVPFHEFGHARALAAMGGTYSYGSFAYGHEFSHLSNYWTLSLLRLITPPWDKVAAYTKGSFYPHKLSPALLKYFGGVEGLRLITAAGGLNNQMLFAKRLTQLSYENKGHITYFPHYFGNKLSCLIYVLHDQDKNPYNDPKINGGSDPGIILRSFKNNGYEINHNHLKALYLLPLLSGTTFAFLRGYYRYVVNNDSVVRPVELYGFSLPDINGYVNTRGLSWEIESDYRIAPFLTAGLAYEFIWKGAFTQTFTPRARYNLAHSFPSLNEFWLSGDLVIGNGIGGSLNATYAPYPLDEQNFWHRFSYAANASIYNAYTLYGERNIDSLAAGNTMSGMVFAGVNLRY